MKREPLINFRSMTPPPRCSGSSHARSSSRECQPGDAQPDPVLQGVIDCLMSISSQMWRMSEGSDKNGGWPRFNGTYKDYPAFRRKWNSYEKHHHQVTPQMELVQMFRENCISKELAYRIRGAETMTEAWAGLDTLRNSPMRFILDLMQEVRAFPKLEEQEYEGLLDYYSLLRNLIKEASKAGYRNGFLTQAHIEEMTRALPLSEKTLWRKREACILPDEHDEAFLTFVNDRQPRIADEAHEVRRIPPMPTPLPIDAARSGSGGGSKGKGTRKNADAVPVQGGNKVKESARANRYPARIRGSNRASDPAQNPGSTSKPAQERSQDTLSRKRSREQDIAARSDGGYEYPQGYDPAGPHADRRSKAPEIPGLRSQEEQYATGATRIVGIVTSGNDGGSSLAQATSATTAPKDGTRQSTNNTTSPALAPKKKKKSGVNKRRASPSPERGEALQVNDEPDEKPRQAYKKPARQQVPVRRQVPSQQPRPATLQAPMGKRGRMERSQRQAAGRAATPFQTTRPPDGQERDGPAY